MIAPRHANSVDGPAREKMPHEEICVRINIYEKFLPACQHISRRYPLNFHFGSHLAYH